MGSLSLTDLALVRALSEEGSLSRAAGRLHYSQPTASHHLASLERRIGGAVARRTGRGTALTEVGAVLAAHATRVLDQVGVVEREIERHLEHGALQFHVGAFPSAGAALLPPALVALAEAGHETAVAEAESPDLQDAVRRGDLHAIIGYHSPGETFSPQDDLVVETLMGDEFVVLLPEDHPLADREAVALDDLADATWVLGTADLDATLALFQHSCRALGFEPDIGYRITDFTMTQGLVAAGLCVAAIPRLGTLTVVDGVLVKPIAGPRINRVVFFAYRRTVAHAASEVALASLKSTVQDIADRGIDVTL